MSIASLVEIEAAQAAVPIWPVTETNLTQWLAGRTDAEAAWVKRAGFTGAIGKHLLLPGAQGALAGVVAGVPAVIDLWSLAGLATALPGALSAPDITARAAAPPGALSAPDITARAAAPPGALSAPDITARAASPPGGLYRIAMTLPPGVASAVALGWALGAYDFTRYRKPAKAAVAQLVWPDGADRAFVERASAASYLARDLINTPANDMGPAELVEAAAALAHRYGAAATVIVGDDLLAENYPLIHAVGRASSRAPRLFDATWGAADAPKVTLVGKGVCFDSGGLDIKTASGMALMKKDMGGAATVIGLARMIMSAGLKLRLRLMIPAVDNAISGSALRPGDVLASRKGLSVEIGNTDAEGRLVLADALAAAAAEQPELLIDCATLTGAARVALGPELPALFTDDDGLASAIERHGRAQADPLWRLPLHGNYRAMLDSKIADINNSADTPFAGAITAALFLKEFVGGARSWAHVDLYAWNAKARPGRPVGGEAMTMRALYALIAERWG